MPKLNKVSEDLMRFGELLIVLADPKPLNLEPLVETYALKPLDSSTQSLKLRKKPQTLNPGNILSLRP